MRILAGIFYLLAFIAIMAVAHLVPATPPTPAKPAATAETNPLPQPQAAPVPVAIPEAASSSPPVGELVEKAFREKSIQTALELEQLQKLILGNSEEMSNLNRKLDQIADTNSALKNENSMLAKRIAEIETRTTAIDQNADSKADSGVPESVTAPEETAPPARPTPRTQSVAFTIGSMDFSEPALETLQKVADEMELNKNLIVSLRGSTSGFGASLGTGRAEVVKSKLAEFGIAPERVKVSDQSGSNGDLVQLSFKKE